MRTTPDEALVVALEHLLPTLGPARGLSSAFEADVRARLLASMPSLKERAKTLVELLDGAYYLYAPAELTLDAKAATILDGPARARVAAVEPELARAPTWDADALELRVRDFAERSGCKLGQVAQPLRAAVTGRGTSPPLFEVMAVLGRDITLSRIRAQAGLAVDAA